MNKNCFPDDGSCDENFEMTLTGMESHGTRYDQNIRNKFENDLLIAQNADDIRTAYDQVVSTNVQAEASLALNKLKKGLFNLTPPLISEKIRNKSARDLKTAEREEIFRQCSKVPRNQWRSFIQQCLSSKIGISKTQPIRDIIPETAFEFSQDSQNLACLASCISIDEIRNELHQIFSGLPRNQSIDVQSTIGADRLVENQWNDVLQKVSEFTPTLTNNHSSKYHQLALLDPR